MATLPERHLTEEQYLRTECRVFSSNLRIKAGGLYTCADCCVISGRPHCVGDQKDVVTNPLLIVEVFSPSTEAYDRGRKFEMYRSSWVLREHSGVEGSVSVARLEIHISLAELYASALELDADERR